MTVEGEAREDGGVPAADEALKIAMLAPPWIPIPPPAYGGIEQVIDLLSAELVRFGHDITLFAAPGSRSPAAVHPLLERSQPESIEQSLFEADHVARAFDEIDEAAVRGEPFNVIHDHCGFTAFAMANRIDVPVVHTLHGPFTDETRLFYGRHATKADAVALSHYQAEQAPDEMRIAAVISNPTVVDRWPFREEKDDYLFWIGRMNEEKGAPRAIAAAREAGVPLVLAGPVQPGQEAFFASEVEPHVDDQSVRYIGEVGGKDKEELYAGARALLMPIRWPEPFGLVMTEAMACGTPVIAYPEGSASEVVVDGETGFLVNDESEMAQAIERLAEIDPARCRQSAEERFDITPVTEGYIDAYRTVIARRTGAGDAEDAAPAGAGRDSDAST